MDQNESTNDYLTNISSTEIRKNLASKMYTVSVKRGRSRVWQVFAKIDTDTGQTIKNYVWCRTCHGVFKFPNSTRNLVKHKCYLLYKEEVEKNSVPVVTNVGQETKKNFQRLILQWSIENCRPVDVIKDSGLQKLAEYLIATGAKYGSRVDMEDLIPQTEEILKNATKLYTNYSAKLKNELKTIRNDGYALTTGLWIDDYLCRTFIFLTIHYIKNGELINRFLGVETFEGDTCKGDVIRVAVDKILQNFDCSLEDKFTFVTEKDDRMTEAFQSSDSIVCVNHLLDCALEEAIDETTEIRNICEVSTKLFNFLKSISEKFAGSVENGSPKRWKTIFHTLASIVVNWNEALKICKSHKADQSKIIKSLNLKQITALQKFFEPFEEASKGLDGISSPTLHLTIVHAHRLRKLCGKSIDDEDFIKNLKVNLLSSFDKFVWQNMTLHHKVALYLFPPANKLKWFSASDKELIRTECKRIMQTFYVEEEEPESSIPYSAMQIDDKHTIIDLLTEMTEEDGEVATKSAKSITNNDIFKDFMEVQGTHTTVEDKLNRELRLYEDTNIMLQDNFNLIKWWEVHQSHFPLLYKTSCKILAVPATAIASKSAILKSYPLIAEKRNELNALPESLNEILFLHCNVEKNKIFSEMVIDEI